MARTSQLEREMESILPQLEADLDPIITDDSDLDMDDFESLSEEDDDDDMEEGFAEANEPAFEAINVAEDEADLDVESTLLEMLEPEELSEVVMVDEDYSERRRGRGNNRTMIRSLTSKVNKNTSQINKNTKRTVGNTKNKLKINREQNRIKKEIKRIKLIDRKQARSISVNSKNIGRLKKAQRLTSRRITKFQRQNAAQHKKLYMVTAQNRKGVRRVAKDAGKNREMLELLQLMVIPKLVAGLVSNQINSLTLEGRMVRPKMDDGVQVVETFTIGSDTYNIPIFEMPDESDEESRAFTVVDQNNDFISSLAPVVPDLAALVGRYTNLNKYTLVAVATVVTALAGYKAIQRSTN